MKTDGAEVRAEAVREAYHQPWVYLTNKLRAASERMWDGEFEHGCECFFEIPHIERRWGAAPREFVL